MSFPSLRTEPRKPARGKARGGRKGLTYDRYNVIAQTSGGDPNNVLVLTAHTDSVDAVCLLSTFCQFS